MKKRWWGWWGLVAIAICVTSIGCTDTDLASFSAYGEEHKVELWSGGKMVKSWTSTGKVSSEESSDGYKFMDKATKKLVRVSGDVVITIVE